MHMYKIVNIGFWTSRLGILHTSPKELEILYPVVQYHLNEWHQYISGEPLSLRVISQRCGSDL